MKIEWSKDGQVATLILDALVVDPRQPPEESEAVRRVLAGLRGDDPAAAGAAFEWIVSPGAIEQVLRGALGSDHVAEEIRTAFHLHWTVRGFRAREELGDDSLLADALQRLLPPYDGPDLTLYRGEQAARAAAGRFGFGWTPARSVAEMFASGLCATYAGGGVLLSAEMPAAGIIAAPSAHSAYLGEFEHIIDPRLLGTVTEIARFPCSP